MISMRHMAPTFAPRTIPPLATNIKLKAINNLRAQQQLPLLFNVPPAQITLTPAAPSMGGENFLDILGYYATQPVGIVLGYQQRDYIQINFGTVGGKTYLLDVSVTGTQNWSYFFVQAPLGDLPTPVTPMQGHLLIPFVACGSVVNVVLSVVTAEPGQFLSAELTQVG